MPHPSNPPPLGGQYVRLFGPFHPDCPLRSRPLDPPCLLSRHPVSIARVGVFSSLSLPSRSLWTRHWYPKPVQIHGHTTVIPRSEGCFSLVRPQVCPLPSRPLHPPCLETGCLLGRQGGCRGRLGRGETGGQTREKHPSDRGMTVVCPWYDNQSRVQRERGRRERDEKTPMRARRQGVY